MNRKGTYTQRRKSDINLQEVVPGLRVTVGDGPRDFERAMRIFSKKVITSGLLRELKERECYEKPSVVKKRARAIARSRWLRQLEEAKNQEF